MPKSTEDMILAHKTTDGIPKLVWVNCEGENEADREYVDEITYKPHHGFPSYYYPYVNTPGYLPPVVAVQFTKVKRNVLINMECTVWAQNVKHVRKTKLGIAHFELLIDDINSKA